MGKLPESDVGSLMCVLLVFFLISMIWRVRVLSYYHYLSKGRDGSLRCCWGKVVKREVLVRVVESQGLARQGYLSL
jgi:hypothetical protein